MLVVEINGAKCAPCRTLTGIITPSRAWETFKRFAIRSECGDVEKKGFLKLMAFLELVDLVGAVTCLVGTSTNQDLQQDGQYTYKTGTWEESEFILTPPICLV